MAAATSKPIKIHIIDDTPTIWNIRDMEILHQNRISGIMDGPLDEGEDDSERGFPMTISVESALLMQEIGVAELVEYPDFKTEPTDVMKVMLKYLEKKNFDSQIQLFYDEREKNIRQNGDKILKSVRARNARLDPSDPQYIPEERLTLEEVIKDKISKLQPPRPGNLLVTTQNQYPFLDNIPYIKATLKFPENDEDRRRYVVFKDLHFQKWWLIDGRDDSLDFYVYKDDPILVHASLGVSVEQSTMPWAEIAIKTRMLHNMKRPLLIAFVNESGKINYQTVRYSPTPFSD